MNHLNRLEAIKDQLAWGKENLDSPYENLDLEDVQWLYERAKESLEQLKE